ncbi:hypothetical protein GN316_15105 [Xylophilus sp. Kf1]|nr:hypothetical protein [Xylophilus sp. Kf1]
MPRRSMRSPAGTGGSSRGCATWPRSPPHGWRAASRGLLPAAGQRRRAGETGGRRHPGCRWPKCAKALAMSETGCTRGKIVLRIVD